MINTDQFLNCMWMAAVLVALGLTPGLYRKLIEGVSAFAGGLRLMPWGRSPWNGAGAREAGEPWWMAVVGALVLLAGFVAYCAR